MADAWSYLPGTTGDAYDRLCGTTGDAWARLPGTEGDAWERTRRVAMVPWSFITSAMGAAFLLIADAEITGQGDDADAAELFQANVVVGATEVARVSAVGATEVARVSAVATTFTAETEV